MRLHRLRTLARIRCLTHRYEEGKDNRLFHKWSTILLSAKGGHFS